MFLPRWPVVWPGSHTWQPPSFVACLPPSPPGWHCLHWCTCPCIRSTTSCLFSLLPKVTKFTKLNLKKIALDKLIIKFTNLPSCSKHQKQARLRELHHWFVNWPLQSSCPQGFLVLKAWVFHTDLKCSLENDKLSCFDIKLKYS